MRPTLGDKSYSPNPIIVETGNTVTWTNMDNIVHTVTSGEPNTVNAGELFDSGLTALIMPSKSFSHKFILVLASFRTFVGCIQPC